MFIITGQDFELVTKKWELCSQQYSHTQLAIS